MTQWAIVAFLLAGGVRRFAGNLADLLREIDRHIPAAERAAAGELRKAIERIVK